MQIWVDADACPRQAKEVLYKAAAKRQVMTTFVANQFLKVPPSPYLKSVQVSQGFDVADNEIVARLEQGDLVVTADIPLADEVIAKGGAAISPRGAIYTKENIKDILSRRDMMEQLRDSGMVSGGPDAYAKKDVQQFANALDRYITQHKK